MSRFFRVATSTAVILASLPLLAAPKAAQAPAPKLTIKLATQAPAGTIWDLQLRKLGSTWAKEDNVTLVVFPGGTQGEEKATIKQMRADQQQAGLLTAGGLSLIDPAFNAFTMPFFFATDEEELAVQKALEPMLQQKLEAKGFHFLCWGTGGWIQLFSKNPLRTLKDVKDAKLFVGKDDVEMEAWYSSNGFHPKPLPISEIGTQLKLGNNGMIDTAPNTPYIAAITQIFTSAKYMLDIHIVPLVGALVITTNAWNQLPQADRDKMTASARVMEAAIRAETPKQDADSITAMKAKGLQVITPDDKALAEFRSAAAELVKTMRGGMVPADVFDRAVQAKGK
jgi:TRAP-type C4-dicarboxylate transport system substrate-binding protein